uniref:Uncharacterized protein n=1 Tax=Acanthochromis polyacanthus TaxID=80966 RepID=A0A3Q1HTF2_9TELE
MTGLVVARTENIIGDSIIRCVRSRLSTILCFPGATVNDIAAKSPDILETHPTVTTVVNHVGTNDVSNVKSFMSGPLPTLGRGIRRFSRLLSLHTWLSTACRNYGIAFIDNFNLLWEHKDTFFPGWCSFKSLGFMCLCWDREEVCPSELPWDGSE